MKINAFTKTYGGRLVLDTPGFELEPGRVCAVIGANGSGKSTMAKILAGAVPADGKTRPFDGTLDVAYMPQQSFAFRMSVEKNLRLSGDEERAKELLEELRISHLARSRAKSLSGGEMARMALARVLMGSHELLILDEPTAAMDMESTALAEKVVLDYCRASGAAVLWVTHCLAQTRRVADTALFFHEGKLLEQGCGEKVLSIPEKEETKRFLAFYGGL